MFGEHEVVAGVACAMESDDTACVLPGTAGNVSGEKNGIWPAPSGERPPSRPSGVTGSADSAVVGALAVLAGVIRKAGFTGERAAMSGPS
jgi:hypothetical protein